MYNIHVTAAFFGHVHSRVLWQKEKPAEGSPAAAGKGGKLNNLNIFT